MTPRVKWLLAGLGVAGLLYLFSRTQTGSNTIAKGVDFVADMTKPRGIRNNNPGNIRLSTTAWAGQVPANQQTDSAFVQFITPEYGIRAFYKVLLKYRTSYGLDTPAGIIGRWAPPTENNTGAYAQAVASALGIGVNDPIGTDKYPALIAAMIKHENGQQPYSAATIAAGMAMA